MVLLRDSPTGLETWLAYRPGSSPLGVLAFPGGSLDAADDDPVDPRVFYKDEDGDEYGQSGASITAPNRT